MKITKVSVRVGRKFVPSQEYRYEPLDVGVEVECCPEDNQDMETVMSILREDTISQVETLIVEATERLYPRKRGSK